MQNRKSSEPLSLEEKEEQRLANLQIQEVKEKIFKLVVKIICWESGSSTSQVVQANNKITKEEWEKYKTHRMKAFNEAEKDKVKAELVESYNNIKAHGGFA